jgi:hypothetical protein
LLKRKSIDIDVMPELLDHSNILEDYHLEMVRVIIDSQKPYCVEVEGTNYVTS